MSRRYYKSSNILRLTKNEKQVFKAIIELFRMLGILIYSICLGIYELSKYIRKIIINHRALKDIGYSLDEIMNLVYKINSRQFEIMIAELFKNSGRYDNVEVTKATNDYGRDVILTKKINGINEVTFVECKHWNQNGEKIGREIAQKLLGSCQMLNAKKAIIVTTGKYHKNAYEAASKVNNLVLMDITDIQKMILDLKPEQISKVIMRTLNAS